MKMGDLDYYEWKKNFCNSTNPKAVVCYMWHHLLHLLYCVPNTKADRCNRLVLELDLLPNIFVCDDRLIACNNRVHRDSNI